jgi:hypothetical protein
MLTVESVDGNVLSVRCECGTVKTMRFGNFARTKACGCLIEASTIYYDVFGQKMSVGDFVRLTRFSRAYVRRRLGRSPTEEQIRAIIVESTINVSAVTNG